LQLIPEEILQLERLRDSQTASWREAQRARILLRYHAGESVSEIARAVHMTRKSVGKWISKALAVGASAALKDAYHRPKDPRITEDANPQFSSQRPNRAWGRADNRQIRCGIDSLGGGGGGETVCGSDGRTCMVTPHSYAHFSWH